MSAFEDEVADLVVDRMRRDQKVATIVADAQMFDDLRTHPGWRRLFNRVQADKSKYAGELARRMMGPKSRRPTDEEIAYQQGFYAGAHWIVSHPDKAMENLERTARIAWLMTQKLSEEMMEGDDS